MKFHDRFLWVLIFSLSTMTGWASDLVFKSRVGTALNGVTMYPDSSYFNQPLQRFAEGTLFKIVEETALEHLDDSQNQKFKWFKVKSQTGKTGWIYGDGLAVVMPPDKISSKLKDFHKQKISLDNGFENSVLWIAFIEGRDNLHDNDFLNPTYHEYYVVLTNEHGKSAHINYESQSAMGRKEVKRFEVLDLTNDGIVEFLLQSKSYSSSSDLENRVLEIFSLQSGTLLKVLNERMTLTYDDDLISPAMFKSIEVSEQSIRVEYVDFLKCKRFSLPFDFDKKSQTQERCLEFVTYTYAWDTRKKRFVQFYKKNKSPLKGIVRRSKIFLMSETSFLSDKIEELKPNQPFIVIKHFEKIYKSNGVKKIAPYLYVQSSTGKRGYIRGKSVQFLNTEHAKILKDYYNKPPLSKTDLKTNKEFLRIEKVRTEKGTVSK